MSDKKHTYVPFLPHERKSIEIVASNEGRKIGQQVRVMTLAQLLLTKKPRAKRS